MKIRIGPAVLFSLLLAFSSLSLCADESKLRAGTEKGAKALFVDSLSGAEIQADGGGKPAAKDPTRKSHPKKSSAVISSAQRVASTGLMYWVEWLKPSGEAVRVTTDQIFHSGDRIRVHLTGSVDGDVAVYQRDFHGQALRLFPDARVNEGSARVQKGASTVIPSTSSWFRFDDQVGTERLLVVLTPVAHAPAPATSTVVASSERPGRDYDQMRPADGSKGLVLETDVASAEPATYIVRSGVSAKPLDPISIEIVLKHER
ncbi:MAG TPA: DUF4384 domain-containing protein [Thermoanaerobaculia bacterium]|nr:DUF4384 domain-containing protein [Thermoanaerobaculia bacterium]